MVNQKSNSGVTQIDVIKVGKFVNGENILFSQYYKAIVFDETNKNVIKKDVADLTQGDIIIFKKNDDSMKDLIDNILEGVLEQGLLDDKINIAYIKANRWKKLLQNYKEKNNLTYTELSEKFAKVGLKRDYATIRSWIDPFSHIVGATERKGF